MRRAWIGLVATMVPMVACTAQGPPPAPIEQSRSVAAAPDEVRARIDGELRNLGFAAGDGGYVKSSAVPEAWARCETIILRGGTNNSGQRDFARPQSRSASVRVSLTPSGGGAQVAVGTTFAATYLNRFQNLPFTAACSSTGALERTLLDAAGPPAPGRDVTS